MNYLFVKQLHISFAALSGSFFLLRGLWMLADSPLLQRRWVRTVPHVVDTLLLGSALALVFNPLARAEATHWTPAASLARILAPMYSPWVT